MDPSPWPDRASVNRHPAVVALAWFSAASTSMQISRANEKWNERVSSEKISDLLFSLAGLSLVVIVGVLGREQLVQLVHIHICELMAIVL
jgi:hypothetical protein